MAECVHNTILLLLKLQLNKHPLSPISTAWTRITAQHSCCLPSEKRCSKYMTIYDWPVLLMWVHSTSVRQQGPAERPMAIVHCRFVLWEDCMLNLNSEVTSNFMWSWAQTSAQQPPTFPTSTAWARITGQHSCYLPTTGITVNLPLPWDPSWRTAGQWGTETDVRAPNA